MDYRVQISIVLAVAIVASIGMWIYFSPYQSCIRGGFQQHWCLMVTSGVRR